MYTQLNSYCKKDSSGGEVNVVEVTQIRLQKMKKNVAMTSFYCLVSKIWKKIVFFVVIRREENAWVVLLFKRIKHFYTGLYIFMQVCT